MCSPAEEERVVQILVAYMKDPAINPWGGSVAVERLQNLMWAEHPELHRKIFIPRRGSWIKFITRHSRVFGSFDEGSTLKVYLRHSRSWYAADWWRGYIQPVGAFCDGACGADTVGWTALPNPHPHPQFHSHPAHPLFRRAPSPAYVREWHIISRLCLFIGTRSPAPGPRTSRTGARYQEGCCTVDEFIAAYPELPGNWCGADGNQYWPLPPRGDLVRLIRRHSQTVTYDPNGYVLRIASCAQ
jgi:hypothetical protein